MAPRPILLLLVVLIQSTCLIGQSSRPIGQASVHIRNVIWTTPVHKNTIINGLAIGFWPTPMRPADSLHINGVNIHASPLDFILAAYAAVGTLFAPFHPKGELRPGSDEEPLSSSRMFLDSPTTTIETHIKGVSLSVCGPGHAVMEGFSVNGVISTAIVMKGVECSGVMNLHYTFRGLMIAGMRNKTTRGKGVQIALFNNCKAGRVIQFGLINRIGKRTLPLMNFSLHKQG